MKTWGDFAAISDLPNVLGSPTQDASLAVGDEASVAGLPYVCSVAQEQGASWYAPSIVYATAHPERWLTTPPRTAEEAIDRLAAFANTTLFGRPVP